MSTETFNYENDLELPLSGMHPRDLRQEILRDGAASPAAVLEAFEEMERLINEARREHQEACDQIEELATTLNAANSTP